MSDLLNKLEEEYNNLKKIGFWIEGGLVPQCVKDIVNMTPEVIAKVKDQQETIDKLVIGLRGAKDGFSAIIGAAEHDQSHKVIQFAEEDMQIIEDLINTVKEKKNDTY